MLIKIKELKRMVFESIKNEMLKNQNDFLILRPKEYQATTEEGFEFLNKIKTHNCVYRGMTEEEYENTIKIGNPIKSTGKYSHQSEGTNFADDALTAESYANSGRDDPRKTGRPTYLVEVEKISSMKTWRDGYIKTQEPVGLNAVKRVWEMFPDDGAVKIKQIF